MLKNAKKLYEKYKKIKLLNNWRNYYEKNR